MKNTEKIRMLFNDEAKILIKNIRKELNFIFSLSFKEYLYNLIFPRNLNFMFKIIRILILFPIFRFLFDSCIFILTIIFNFYFLFFERVFDFLKKFFIILFDDTFILKPILRIISFFRYIFLFMFFVNIVKNFKKKKIRL
jgi:hypothetical protein